jgi:prolyl-tRNA synthetase
MVHGDNKGLVLPPRCAQHQVVIIPIHFKEDDPTILNAKVDEIAKSLKEAGVRVITDTATHHNPGWKYNHWEMKGTPIRIEIGKKDFAKSEVKIVKRFDGVKQQIAWEGIQTYIKKTLIEIQD